jgi:type I restriction enzyme S subunit
MPRPWPLVPLEELLKPVSRPETVDADKTYRILGAHWYAQGLYVKDTTTGAGIQAKSLYRVQEGDFVYNRLFAWKGSFALATKENDGCYVSNEFPCFKVSPSRLDGRFLLRFFSRSSTWDEALSESTGGTPTSRNRLKEHKFLAFKIPVPPLDEQRRIVARIEQLAAKIQEVRGLREQSITETEEILPLQAERKFEALSHRHPKRNFSSFEPHVTSGPRNWGPRHAESGFRFYRAQDIGPDSNLVGTSKMFIVPPNEIQGANAKLMPGDLMMVITGATVGRCAVFPAETEPGFVNQHVALCRLPATEVFPHYALWGLRAPSGRGQLLGQRYGQGKPGLNLSNIRAITLPFPPLNEQRRIVAYLDRLQAKVDTLKKLQTDTAAELDALMPSILDKAFRGEL